MKILNWFKDNLNFVSMLVGLGLLVAGDTQNGLDLVKGGLH